MELNDFQAHCQRTAVYPTEDAVIYCALGLVSEAGEVDVETISTDRLKAAYL